MTESIEIDTNCDFESTNKLLPFTARNMPKYGLPLIHIVMIKNANFFMVIVSLLRTHQWREFTMNNWREVLQCNGITWLNVTSFRPCCHNWLVCICFCVCVCLLPRTFCLVCYCLCVEQLLAFHWDIAFHWHIANMSLRAIAGFSGDII